MKRVFYTGVLIALFYLLSVSQVVAGPNANATVSVDLVIDGSGGNQFDDGVTSGTVTKQGTRFSIEVFAKGVTTTLIQATCILELGSFNEDFLYLEEMPVNDQFPNRSGYTSDDPQWRHSRNVTSNYLSAGPDKSVSLNASGFLMRLDFITKRDITEQLTICVSRVSLHAEHENGLSRQDDVLGGPHTTVTINPTVTFSNNPPTNNPVNNPKKNMLPGDLDGNGSVNYADLVIFTDNFGRTDGDTFNPNDLVEASLIPTGSATLVTVTVYETITKYEIINETVLPRPDVVVKPGNWDLSVDEMDKLLEQVRDIFGDQLMYPFDSDITVEYKSPEGPKVLYNRAADGSYVVWLDVREGSAQPIFQFAHEYAHILANYRNSTPYQQQLWFEESIAALASLYALKEIQTIWRGSSNQSDQINAWMVETYYDDLVKSASAPENLAQWYQVNKTQLEADPYLRDENRSVALALFDIFEDHPDEAWNAVRYMNRGPVSVGRDFSLYLNDWRKRTPARWQFIVEEIMTRFGIQRSGKPTVNEHNRGHVGIE